MDIEFIFRKNNNLLRLAGVNIAIPRIKSTTWILDETAWYNQKHEWNKKCDEEQNK